MGSLVLRGGQIASKLGSFRKMTLQNGFARAKTVLLRKWVRSRKGLRVEKWVRSRENRASWKMGSLARISAIPLSDPACLVPRIGFARENYRGVEEPLTIRSGFTTTDHGAHDERRLSRVYNEG
jgi:hypothetical protein